MKNTYTVCYWVKDVSFSISGEDHRVTGRQRRLRTLQLKLLYSVTVPKFLQPATSICDSVVRPVKRIEMQFIPQTEKTFFCIKDQSVNSL